MCYECYHDRFCNGVKRAESCETMKKEEFQKLIKVGIKYFLYEPYDINYSHMISYSLYRVIIVATSRR